jgi:hypothetical protein
MPRRYQPWLTLSEAADLIAPVPQADICRALVDGRIKFHALIDYRDHVYGGRWVGHDISTGTNLIGVRVPSLLHPEHLDWTGSRPLEHWEVGVDVPNHKEDLAGYVPRTITRLELLRSDVEEVFGIAEQPAKAPQQPLPEPVAKALPAPPGRRGPRPVKRDSVKAAMLKDIHDGRFTVQELRDMPEESMAAEYKASRDVCRSARQEVCDSL